jgi:4-diphosphocytidyl-2-C-methyl-D-erythritol kinase
MREICFPNCKINLGLRILRRRDDGYHDIETIFYPVPLRDEIEINTTGKDGNPLTEDVLTTSGISLPSDTESNLVMKVLRMLREEGRDIPPLSIRLEKNIPSGAGLGGGSSDAAFMMKMLNKVFSLNMSDDEMEERVGRLGADCAFFVRNTPVIASGIGNVFTPTSINLKGYWIWLAKPSDFVSTKEAYQAVRPDDTRRTAWPQSNGDIRWEELVNDFEVSVFPGHPNISRLKTMMQEKGAVYAAMSGSGATVFGLFKEKPRTAELPEDVFSFVAQL